MDNVIYLNRSAAEIPNDAEDDEGCLADFRELANRLLDAVEGRAMICNTEWAAATARLLYQVSETVRAFVR